jgi:hypothetical protein
MSTRAGETALKRRSALAGPVVNNPSGLFKSLETTPHFGLWRTANSCAQNLRAHRKKPALYCTLPSGPTPFKSWPGFTRSGIDRAFGGG